MTKSRKIWLDVVRATAILCVVLCHSVEAFYRPVLLGQLQVSFLSGILKTCFLLSGGWGFRCFLLLPVRLYCPGIILMFLPFIRNHCSHYSLLRKYGFFSITFLLCDWTPNIQYLQIASGNAVSEILLPFTHVVYARDLRMLHCTPFSFPVIADIHKPPGSIHCCMFLESSSFL